MASLKPDSKETGDTGNDKDAKNLEYLTICLNEARKSPPKPTNFRVGACLVAYHPKLPNHSNTELLTTGYTLECEGNTHAEQSCFLKLAATYKCSESDLGLLLPENTWLYTTMEPCNKRSVGNTPCVDRILNLRRPDGRIAIEKVFVGVLEPGTFVGVNEGQKRLEEAGIEVVKVDGLEEEILRVATEGHEKG
jgi:pyrimidine deaminase RibD-like protein